MIERVEEKDMEDLEYSEKISEEADGEDIYEGKKQQNKR